MNVMEIVGWVFSTFVFLTIMVIILFIMSFIDLVVKKIDRFIYDAYYFLQKKVKK